MLILYILYGSDKTNSHEARKGGEVTFTSYMVQIKLYAPLAIRLWESASHPIWFR